VIVIKSSKAYVSISLKFILVALHAEEHLLAK
jgi:hypothetical protein